MQQLPSIQIPIGKKIYFASDFHLGIPDAATSLQREKIICNWLNTVSKDAAHIYLLGDLFDTWMEYNNVVPKGFVRLLGTLGLLKDKGVNITVFTGNHDLWMYGYFEQELSIPVIHHPVEITINNKLFVLGHGDGLGKGDTRYKILKTFLRSNICQWLFRRIHPNIGLRVATYFSKRGLDKKEKENIFYGEDKEYLIGFCKTYIQQNPSVNYFIFGHRHYKMKYAITATSTYINLGDWLSYNSYAVFDGVTCTLITYNE